MDNILRLLYGLDRENSDPLEDHRAIAPRDHLFSPNFPQRRFSDKNWESTLTFSPFYINECERGNGRGLA
jgi:hypothetical protein